MQILTYHKIGPKFDLGITHQSQNQLFAQLKNLKEEGFGTVSLEKAGNPQENSSPKSFAITFDDGYENIYTYAFPILQELGYTATVFMVTGFTGKYNSWDFNFGRRGFKHLNWEQIKEMSKYGISFGSHTVNHPDLTKLDRKYVEYELRNSKQALEEKLGQEVKFFSYPFGKYNSSIREEVKIAGYQNAFTLSSNGSAKNFDPYAITRIGVYRFDTLLSLKIKLEGGFWYGLENLKGNLINRLSYGTSIVKAKPKYNALN